MSDQEWPDFYILPSSPTTTCQDRFGLVDADTLNVPFWSVLTALLTPPIHSITAFIDILASIAVELRGYSPSDYHTLQASLHDRETEFLHTIWPSIARLALDMPQLFPDHRIPVLKESGKTHLEMSSEQVACLVTHQFLATMAAPAWQEGLQNFDIWYKGEQPHVRAPGIYITSTLEYFKRIAATPSLLDYGDWEISYELVSRTGNVKASNGEAGVYFKQSEYQATLGDIDLESMSERTGEAEFLGTHGNAVVISANKYIGFGRSATQEEVFVGTTPEACPAVLVTPPLASHQVLVVRGCEAMVKTVGLGRQIKAAGVHENFPLDNPEQYKKKWQNRTMLFMDALEVDSFDSSEYPDIQHVNLRREMVKALTAFGSGTYLRIYTGLWGCGTFGGDSGVKMVVLWIAASVKGSGLSITYEEGREGFAEKMREFIQLVRDRAYTVEDVWRLLWEAEGKGLEKGTFLELVLEKG